METPIPNKKKEESIQRRIAHPNYVSSDRLPPIGSLQVFFFDLFGAIVFVAPCFGAIVFVAPTKVYIMCANWSNRYEFARIGHLQLFSRMSTRGYENGRSRFGPTNTVKPTFANIMCANGRHRYEYMRIGWQLGIYLHVYWTRGHIFGGLLKVSRIQP